MSLSRAPLTLLLLLAACGTSPGQLSITVSGLPPAASADVEVTGAAGSIRVAASTDLNDLTPGAYSVTASDVSIKGVDYVPTVSGAPAQIKAGASAAVTVTYVAAGTGTLNLSVTGLPASLAASLTVNGPNGFSQSVSGTASLSGLGPGQYSISVGSAREVGHFVSTLFEGTASPSAAAVSAGNASSIEVRYAPRPGTGNLWSRAAFAMGGFNDDALGASAQQPTSGLAIGDSKGPLFDHAGNLWAIQSGSLSFFPKTALTGGFPTPAVIISAPQPVRSAAFDASGNLWVSDTTPAIRRFSAATLSNSSAAADVTLTLASIADAIAFDMTGALWAATEAPAIIELSPQQLTSSGAPTPAATVMDPFLVGMHGLAFDAQGNLFATVSGSQPGIAVIPASTTTVHALPILSGYLSFPWGLAFDEAGDLWVSDINNNVVYMFGVGDLYAGSSFVASEQVRDNSQPANIAFDPPPDNLPLAP